MASPRKLGVFYPKEHLHMVGRYNLAAPVASAGMEA